MTQQPAPTPAELKPLEALIYCRAAAAHNSHDAPAFLNFYEVLDAAPGDPDRDEECTVAELLLDVLDELAVNRAILNDRVSRLEHHGPGLARATKLIGPLIGKLRDAFPPALDVDAPTRLTPARRLELTLELLDRAILAELEPAPEPDDEDLGDEDLGGYTGRLVHMAGAGSIAGYAQAAEVLERLTGRQPADPDLEARATTLALELHNLEQRARAVIDAINDNDLNADHFAGSRLEPLVGPLERLAELLDQGTGA